MSEFLANPVDSEPVLEPSFKECEWEGDSRTSTDANYFREGKGVQSLGGQMGLGKRRLRTVHCQITF